GIYAFQTTGKRRFVLYACQSKDRDLFCDNRLSYASNVTETSLRADWRDAENDHAPGFAGDVQRSGDDLAVFLRLSNIVICGQNREQGIAARCLADMNCCQPDCDGSVQPIRLAQHAPA